MKLRRLCALAVLPFLLALGACTTSGSGSADSSSAAPSTGTTDAAALAAKIKSALADVTSAHIKLDITLAAQALTGEGDEKLENGKLVALDLTENLPGNAGSIRIVVVDGKTYAKLPRSMNPNGGKPWLLVTKDSNNPVIRQLASSLDSALSSASLVSVSTFASAAKSIEAKGTEQVAGVTATHYSIKVDIAKLPADLPGKSELQASGLKTLPIELYIDEQGRPVKLTEKLQVQGSTVSTTATVTDYNKPVTITAPPADQIGR